MSQPKKKVSRSHRDKRRYSAANLLQKVTTVSCPNCNEPKRPHRVCACGFYAGKEVRVVAAKVAQK
jgi:large subunit ribosomal protein L32